jgi:hypothetical protein
MVWRLIPLSAPAEMPFDMLFGTAQIPANSRGVPLVHLDEVRLAITVTAAMAAAILLSLPVAWVYQLTREKRGYQQSVVQLLIILPLVVAGIVVMVKYSIALAFSLAGIVAAVRFRNTLDDSKDAVYVFLATALGLAAGVNIPVAVVISVLFNAAILILWATDFGHAPVALDGKIAERRMRRARELAQTGTFVARVDDEVFRGMTREQLEGVAERALERARDADSTGADLPSELRLRLTTKNPDTVRRNVERELEERTKRWNFSGQTTDGDGIHKLDYMVRLKKKTKAEDLLASVRVAGRGELLNVELE